MPESESSISNGDVTTSTGGTTASNSGSTASNSGATVPDSGTTAPNNSTTVPDSDTTAPNNGTTVSDGVTPAPNGGTTVPDSGTTAPNKDSTPSETDADTSGSEESEPSGGEQGIGSDQDSGNDQESASDQESNDQDGANDQESVAPTPSVTEAVYTYRDAQYSIDDYHVTANVENCVVITGVSTPASDGVYRIPSTIEGKKVIAITRFAFGEEAIRETVKAVYVPASLRTIWEFAFSGCVNLTDLYFYGTSIYVDSQAFPAKEHRNGTLTIHCAYDCNNRDFRYYRNIAESYYDAEYEEWNG